MNRNFRKQKSNMYKAQIWSIKTVTEKAILDVVSWPIITNFDYGQVFKVTVELTHAPFKIDEAYATDMPVEKNKEIIAGKITHYIFNVSHIHTRNFTGISKMHLGIWSSRKKNDAYIIRTIEVGAGINMVNVFYLIIEYLTDSLDSSFYETIPRTLPVLILIEKPKLI